MGKLNESQTMEDVILLLDGAEIELLEGSYYGMTTAQITESTLKLIKSARQVLQQAVTSAEARIEVKYPSDKMGKYCEGIQKLADKLVGETIISIEPFYAPRWEEREMVIRTSSPEPDCYQQLRVINGEIRAEVHEEIANGSVLRFRESLSQHGRRRDDAKAQARTSGRVLVEKTCGEEILDRETRHMAQVVDRQIMGGFTPPQGPAVPEPAVFDIARDTRPQLRGWAPGYYSQTCWVCGKLFVGDKRASICAPCAYHGADALARMLAQKMVSDPTVPPGEVQFRDPTTGQVCGRIVNIETKED